MSFISLQGSIQFIKNTHKYMIKQFSVLSFLLLFSYTNAYSQNNDIDFGNGSVGDISFYNEYKPYITDSLIPFAYNILQKDKPHHLKINLSADKGSDSIRIGYTVNNLLKIGWNSNGNIQKIKEKDIRYKIDYLFKKYTDYNEPYPVTLLELNEFTINKRKFVLLQTAYDCNINAINSLTFTFVFEIINNDIKYVPFRSSAHSSLLCYGDFDNDGNLDYLDLEGCELTMYIFKDNKIIKNEDYFLRLDCQQVSPEVELIFIKLNKSKWSFDLKNAWNSFK